MIFYAIPNNNQGISLAYANIQFLFSTGVANSTATSKICSGSVGPLLELGRLLMDYQEI